MKEKNIHNILYTIGVLDSFYEETENEACKIAIDKLREVIDTEPREE